jgi:hypothetical protein
LGLVFLGTIPVFFSHSTIGYANLPLSCYLVLGTIWAIQAILSNDQDALITSSFLFGFAGWTIIEGVFYASSTFLVLIVAGGMIAKPKLHLRLSLLPFIVVSGVWFLFYFLYGASGSQAAGAFTKMVESYSRGEYDLYSFRMIFGYFRRHFLKPKPWGILFPLAAFMIVLGSVKRKIQDDLVYILLALSIVSTGLMTVYFSYLRSFAIYDYYQLLVRGFPRYFLPSAVLIAIFAVYVVGTSKFTHLSDSFKG